MAHQATNIPWNTLASHLKWSVAKHHPENGDLHLRFKPDQGKQFHYFVEAFARNIRRHSATARKRYPEAYEAPKPDDILLDDAVVRKITPGVHRFRSRIEWDYAPLGRSVLPPKGGLCTHGGGDIRCHCPIPNSERKAVAFYRPRRFNNCFHFFEENGDGFFTLELVKTLLMDGEMDIILRICASPDVQLWHWWRLGMCECEPDDVGWDMIVKAALLAYIALNVVYCFPETWDTASGRTDEKDYRRMRIYQYMVRNCTLGGTASEVVTYPHRRFFDVEDNQFVIGRDARNFKQYAGRGGSEFYPYGRLSFQDFLACEVRTAPKPARSAMRAARRALHSKGLPTELVLEILEFAGLTEAATSSLEVPYDPFHPRNWDELAKYLRHCWELLVRCDMLATALGQAIPWHTMISEALIGLFSCREPGVPEPRRWYERDQDGRVTFR
ncbi:hypothetical protein VTK26DRAFT_2407 [Humicola hyalothermophila]